MSRSSTRLAPAILLAAAGLLGACSPDYPMDQPNTWSTETLGSSNDANLRAMVANPADLAEGRGASTSLGQEAAPAVGAMLHGARAPLPATDSLSIDTLGSAPAPPAGASPDAGP